MSTIPDYNPSEHGLAVRQDSICFQYQHRTVKSTDSIVIIDYELLSAFYGSVGSALKMKPEYSFDSFNDLFHAFL